eukprot:49214_1
MGRKKGKQGGISGYKSKSAAFATEINNYVSEHYQSSSSSRQRQRQGQLRGILRERIMDDRQRDANHRRIFTTTTRTRQSHSITSTLAQAQAQTQTLLSCNKEIPPVGWLMNYDHRERMAGILPRTSRDDAARCVPVPSLHSLCIDALAPVLNAYIEALGKTYIHDRLGLLPSTTISDISMRCQDINDSMAYVVGAHSDVDRIVWNG